MVLSQLYSSQQNCLHILGQADIMHTAFVSGFKSSEMFARCVLGNTIITL